MNMIEKIEALKKTGQPVVDRLFKLTDAELKRSVSGICGSFISDEVRDSVLGKDGQVTRTIKNEENHDISIDSYDSIEINFMGIFFKPEHGDNKQIVEFNEYFRLNF